MAVTDSIMVTAYLLLVACTVLVSLHVWYNFQDTMAETVAESPGNSTVVQVMNEIQGALESIDYMFPVIIGGLLIAYLIFAF
jgi:hypothetical protein